MPALSSVLNFAKGKRGQNRNHYPYPPSAGRASSSVLDTTHTSHPTAGQATLDSDTCTDLLNAERNSDYVNSLLHFTLAAIQLPNSFLDGRMARVAPLDAVYFRFKVYRFPEITSTVRYLEPHGL